MIRDLLLMDVLNQYSLMVVPFMILLLCLLAGRFDFRGKI